MAGIIYWSLKILQRFLPNSPIIRAHRSQEMIPFTSFFRHNARH